MLNDDLPPLPRPYLTVLVSLAEAGGFGKLDTHGRITVGPTNHPLQGDVVTWMVLVSRGLVAGERGQIMLTAIGRDVANEVIAGRVRVAM